jgi:hypothetical protein
MDVTTWTSSNLDEILKEGEVLYKNGAKMLPKNEIYMNYENVQKQITIFGLNAFDNMAISSSFSINSRFPQDQICNTVFLCG